MNRRVWILLGAVAVAIMTIFRFPAIPQSEAYHDFADRRLLFGIANCFNVISNAPFFLVGILGIKFVPRPQSRLEGRGLHPAANRLEETGLLKPLKPGSSSTRGLPLETSLGVFLDPRERWPYFTFFAAVTLTAFGSAWYHLCPNDHTLVWDRIPMAVGFMALVAAMVAERIGVKAGVRLLLPLVVVGIGSVIYWDVTQSRGHGDLRPYALAQFGSLLALLLIFGLFPARYTRGSDFIVSLALYGVAKIFEAVDKLIFALSKIVSGHTIKHLFAALSAYWILRMLRLRAPIPVSRPGSN